MKQIKLKRKKCQKLAPSKSQLQNQREEENKNYQRSLQNNQKTLVDFKFNISQQCNDTNKEGKC